LVRDKQNDNKGEHIVEKALHNRHLSKPSTCNKNTNYPTSKRRTRI